MNNDTDLDSLVLELSKSIEVYSDRIDTHNLLGVLIGLCHMIGDTLGYKRKDFNHILKELINKKYMG